MPRQFVGGREEEAFECLRARRKIANQRRIARGKEKIAGAHELCRFQFAGDVDVIIRLQRVGGKTPRRRALHAIGRFDEIRMPEGGAHIGQPASIARSLVHRR